MSERTLIKGGIVLTQDESLGEMPGADILVEDDRIVDVRPGLSADGAKVIDATGDIVIPGFIDTHRHTWETSIRTCAPDYALITYFSAILDQFAPKYRPEDVYAANQWGALECINAGITTLVDWSHIMNTPAHADAAINGLKDTGHPVGLRVGLPEHVAPGLVVRARLGRQRRDDRRRPRPPDPQGRPERRPGPRSRWRWPRAARTSASPTSFASSGSSPGSSASTSRSTSRWTGSATRRCSCAASRRWISSTRTRRTSTRRTCSKTSGRWSATPAGTSRWRRRSSSRWATAGRPPRPPSGWASRSG